MSRSLNDLDPKFRPLVDEFLAKIREKGIFITIITTGRTQAEQDAALAHGVSQVKVSKHQAGLAIDICPNDLLAKKGWDPGNPLWWEIAEIGLALGLRWGGKWEHPMPPVGKVPKYFFDPGHYEMVEPKVIS